MPNYKCQCCGHEQEFADGQAAFDAGWDAPPYFTQVVTCNLCPAVCALGAVSHKLAHAAWERNGRPADFDHNCAPDEDFVSKEEFSEKIRKGREIAEYVLGVKLPKSPLEGGQNEPGEATNPELRDNDGAAG